MRIVLFPLAAALILAGCATATHESKVGTTIAATSQGDVSSAIAQLETQTASGENKTDLLLNLEKGELLRISTRYQDSMGAFEVADARIKAWEETAKSDPAKLFGQVGALFGGDASRTYEGQDYEKVMLTTRMAMNRINLGDLDTARVDIKRTHEREALIAEFRAKEAAAAEDEAKEKGVTSTAKELNGYPIETLNDPEVLKLKNGYQNALSHYLAGFVYEALNEPGLAAPGYRKAIELRPDLPVLEEGLRGLDKRTSFRRTKGVTDVLFIIETGNAPARQSQKVAFPVPTTSGLVTISFAFPAIYPDPDALAIDQLQFGKHSMKTALVTDFNVMARKALKDELPGIQARAATRAIAKALVQDQANKRLGFAAGLLANLAVAATEAPADDRMWRSLPDRVFIARGFVEPGEYELRLPGQADGVKKISVNGRYMVVPVRLFKNKTYFGEVAQLGTTEQLAKMPAKDNASSTRTAKVRGKGKARAGKAPVNVQAAAN